MKKLLIFFLMSVMTLAANAQNLTVSKNVGLNGHAKNLAKKASGLDGTSLWGYYLGDGSDFGGLGTGQAGSFRVAIFVPGNGILQGAKIRGINIPAVAAMSDVTAWVATGKTNSSITASVKAPTIASTYTAVEFEEPIEIPTGGLYAGYTFSSTAQYPIALAEGEAAGALFLSTSATGNLDDYSTAGYGMSGIQLFVEGMDIPDYGVSISDVYCEPVLFNSASKATVYFDSNGSKGAKSLEYVLTVNGVEKTETVNLKPTVPGGLNKKGSFEVEFNAPAEVGTFPASISITKIDGVDNETAGSTNFTISTVSRIVPRMTVVEEFTGTGCGYCPRGWVGMEKVKNELSDKALVIAWHSYNSTDPMYAASYANIPFDGAPQCTVDRKIFPDPYYGMNEEGIINCTEAINEATPTVDITATAKFTDETNAAVAVSANTEFLTDTKNYSIAFVLTADSLCGTTSSWKQTNYYYQYTAAQIGDPELAPFCTGGIYGKSSVALVFNDVLIGSSYGSNGASLANFAKSSYAAEEVASTEYTVKMPTKTALKNALKYNKVYATVLVIDNNGYIANAKRVRVLGFGEEEVDTVPGETPDVQLAGILISHVDEDTQIMAEAASDNMTYAVGANFATYAPVVWNTVTGEIKNYPDFEEGTFHAVNNAGLAVGDNGNYAIAYHYDGTPINLFYEVGEVKHNDELEYDYTTGDAGSSAYCVSEDGKTIGGFYFMSDYTTFPCIWNENGERTVLPLPTSEEAGFEVNGGEVRWMSADASILLGVLIDNMATWPAAIWRKNAQGTYDCEFISKDFWEEGYQQGKPYMVFNPQGISANGEWISLNVQAEFDDWNFDVPAPPMQGARFNLNTKALEFVKCDNGAELSVSGIANDGTVIGYVGAEGIFGRSGYICPANSNVAVSINDMIEGIEGTPALGSNTPCTISSDAKKVMGFGIVDSMDVDFFSYILEINIDATDGINFTEVAPVRKSSEKIFNVTGQQVSSMNARGLYITNGKKALVK